MLKTKTRFNRFRNGVGGRSKSTIDTSGRGDPSGRHQLSARGGNSEMPTSSIVAPSDRVTRSSEAPLWLAGLAAAGLCRGRNSRHAQTSRSRQMVRFRARCSFSFSSVPDCRATSPTLLSERSACRPDKPRPGSSGRRETLRNSIWCSKRPFCNRNSLTRASGRSGKAAVTRQNFATSRRRSTDSENCSSPRSSTATRRGVSPSR